VHYIAQHQIERPKLAKLLKRLIAVGGQCYSMTGRLQQRLQKLKGGFVVINQENSHIGERDGISSWM